MLSLVGGKDMLVDRTGICDATRVLHITRDGEPLCGIVSGDTRLPEGHFFASREGVVAARTRGVRDDGLCPECEAKL